MARRVDHEERRQQVAAAVLRVVSRDGLEAVSLRHVASEAGVTAGMVQHYFPSKDSMMNFAMRAASERYEERIKNELAQLGNEPESQHILRAILGALLPSNDIEGDDARVALAFQTYAVTHPDAAAHLEEGNTLLRQHFTDLIRAANSSHGSPHSAAASLLAVAEGLGSQMLSSRLPAHQAHEALEYMIETVIKGE